MSDEDFRKKEDFYDEKGWDMDKVPTHSGKLILPDGTLVRIEGRLVEGSRGDFWTGGCYIPESSGRSSDRRDDRGRGRDRDRDDRRGRDDRGRGRDDRRDDRRSERDRAERSRDGRDSGRSQSSFDHDLDDDVPF